MRVIVTNTHELGAGLYFNQKNYLPYIEKSLIVPLAADPIYEEALHQLVTENKIDIIFSGTQHEILRISQYSVDHPIAAVLPPAVLNIALDKLETARFFARHPILVPTTWLLEDLISQVDNSYFPLVLKPRSSSSSRSIYIIKNRDDWDDFFKTNPNVNR